MAQNIEIKARVKDLQTQKKLAQQIAEGEPCILKQHDIFFNVPNGRLKLRILESVPSELIYYKRPDTTGVRQCDYTLTLISDPLALRAVLEPSLGIRGEVKKQRTLFITGQTRIHLDRVERLGNFIELEYVMKPDEPLENGVREVDRLMRHLGIEQEDLLGLAYIDLIAPLR